MMKIRNGVSLILILFSFLLSAQNFNIESTVNYLKYKELDKAKEAIDKAYENEATSNNYRMWHYRGRTYLEIANDTNFNHLDAQAADKAAESFINSLKTDTKNKYKEDNKKLLMNAAFALYNDGIVAYNKKQFSRAIECYSKIIDIIPYDETKTLARNNVSDGVLYINCYYASVEMKDMNKAKQYLDKLISIGYNDPLIYVYMSRILVAEKDTVAALSYIEKGRGTFDDNMDLINEELNIYIMQNKTDVLVDKLTVAIEADPNYELLYFNRGTLYEKKEENSKAEADYVKALELKPGYFDALYNLGAMHYNSAVGVQEKMNKLSLNEQTKYDKLKAERDALFKKALPHLEQAHLTKQDDLNTLIALKEIYAKTGDFAKSKEIKQKIADLNK